MKKLTIARATIIQRARRKLAEKGLKLKKAPKMSAFAPEWVTIDEKDCTVNAVGDPVAFARKQGWVWPWEQVEGEEV